MSRVGPAGRRAAERKIPIGNVRRWVAEYSAQGVHRTGTEVDARSLAWLAGEIEGIGARPILQEFPFERLAVSGARLVLSGEAVEGVPLFDCLPTGPSGVRGRLGPVGGGGDIVVGSAIPSLTEAPPSTHAATRALLDARTAAGTRGLVLITDGSVAAPGLALMNAWDYEQPWDPPGLQVPSGSHALLDEQVRRESEAILTIEATREATRVSNVGARLDGRDESLAPLVVITPRSGWFGCASERGGGVAVWLAILSALVRTAPRRPVIFSANTAHEVGYLGVARFVEAHPGLDKSAHAWVHLGANFAARGGKVTIQYSDEEIAGLVMWAMESRGIAIDQERGPDTRPVGEARDVFDAGGRYASLLGTNPLFHHELDLWPDAVDGRRLEAMADAWVEIALALAV